MKLLFSFAFMAGVCVLCAQPADTATASYKAGYYIGAWLPFLFIGCILLVMYLVFRKRAERG